MKFLPSTRPYWFVDAKWVCGLLFLMVSALCFCLLTLVNVTDQKHGPKIAALTVGSLFMRGDSTVNKEEARAEIRKQGGQLHPLPNFPSVVITEKDLELSDSEIKLKVFQPLTQMIYDEGVEKTADKFAKTPEERQKFINDAAVFRLMTKKTHDVLISRLTVFSVIAVLSMVGVVYFSAGWGRLANPGFLLAAASIFWTLLFTLLAHPPKDTPDGNVMGFLPPDIAKEIGGTLGGVYLSVTIFGFMLLVAAGIGKLIFVLTKKQQNSSRHS